MNAWMEHACDTAGSAAGMTMALARNARPSRTLGAQREGTGVVIDSEGLVLTIGYLIIEAETVELSTADGRAFPATVIGYDNASGFGLLKEIRPLPVKPVQFGQSASVAERE